VAIAQYVMSQLTTVKLVSVGSVDKRSTGLPVVDGARTNIYVITVRNQPIGRKGRYGDNCLHVY
jgi:hypothetical protein